MICICSNQGLQSLSIALCKKVYAEKRLPCVCLQNMLCLQNVHKYENVNMTENQLIDIAFDNLKAATSLQIDLKSAPAKEIDGVALFRFGKNQEEVVFEVKTTVQPVQLPKLEAFKKKYPHLLVVTQHLYPKMKQQLRDLGINYLEANGNVSFRGANIFLFREDPAAVLPAEAKVRGRAFTKTGLKLVFQLLVNEQLVNMTYRELAAATGVGFGNINVIMTDLKEQGFLIPLGPKTYQLHRKKELLEKWTLGYEQKLKPALHFGNFRFLNQEDFKKWERVAIDHEKTQWGGEPGGHLLTNYLLPGRLTLYTVEPRGALMKNYKLVPDANGTVEVYQKFWGSEAANNAHVPALLIYVDLMLTGDRRCMETAQKIWDEKLQDKF